MLQEAPKQESAVLDRCDRCCGQAKVFTILLMEAGKLQWCSHHWEAVKNDLSPRVAQIIDERDDPDA